MAGIWSSGHRYATWRRVWIALAEAQSELGLPITPEDLAALRQAAPRLDLARVAEIEAETRHDVVSHLRHFAEQAGAAGGKLHLGATSAFVTDNTDLLLLSEALELVERRLGGAIRPLAHFARTHRALPALAYTHLQPAQLTTVGKRACLWIQDLVEDYREVARRRREMRLRGAKGTTGTQASFMTLFDGDEGKVVELDRRLAAKLGFERTWPITGQTYPRKADSQLLSTLSGIGESLHKMGNDIRLLQSFGEVTEPFGKSQVGSSAMPYKRNPMRSERMCSLSRRLLTAALDSSLTAATQWLERTLDDSAIRRLVLPEAFLLADAVLGLAADIGGGLVVHERTLAARVARELPFMATEALMMKGTVGGGSRQELHERIRELALEAHAAVEAGEENPLLGRLAEEPALAAYRGEIERLAQPEALTGRAAQQVDRFLADEVEPLLSGVAEVAAEAPRV
jgi:adenylosuccinate lyase